MSDPYEGFNNRMVSRWLDRKLKESMRQGIRTLAAQLEAEQRKRRQPGGGDHG